MDPDEAFDEMTRALARQDLRTARDRAADIRDWVQSGKFPPDRAGYEDLLDEVLREDS